MFHLGKRSLRELEGVHPLLVDVVHRAIKTSTQDFTVIDGLRTIEQQREYVRKGVSQTMNSKHLPQPDGYSHAVDLAPYIGGKVRWEMEACYAIAEAMRVAAAEADASLVWGGCWEPLTGSESPKAMVRRYVDARLDRGRRAFVDAVHYQLAG